MSTFPTPLPVVLCGKTTQMGRPVSKLLSPEYEGSYESISLFSTHTIYVGFNP